MDPNDTPMESHSDKQQCPYYNNYTNYLTRFLPTEIKKKKCKENPKTVPLYVVGTEHAFVKLH